MEGLHREVCRCCLPSSFSFSLYIVFGYLSLSPLVSFSIFYPSFKPVSLLFTHSEIARFFIFSPSPFFFCQLSSPFPLFFTSHCILEYPPFWAFFFFFFTIFSNFTGVMGCGAAEACRGFPLVGFFTPT